MQDVSFSGVVEGTRQYFLGVPRPPPPRHDPHEPEPHIIHKASVVRAALQQRVPPNNHQPQHSVIQSPHPSHQHHGAHTHQSTHALQSHRTPSHLHAQHQPSRPNAYPHRSSPHVQTSHPHQSTHPHQTSLSHQPSLYPQQPTQSHISPHPHPHPAIQSHHSPHSHHPATQSHHSPHPHPATQSHHSPHPHPATQSHHSPHTHPATQSHNSTHPHPATQSHNSTHPHSATQSHHSSHPLPVTQSYHSPHPLQVTQTHHSSHPHQTPTSHQPSARLHQASRQSNPYPPQATHPHRSSPHPQHSSHPQQSSPHLHQKNTHQPTPHPNQTSPHPHQTTHLPSPHPQITTQHCSPYTHQTVQHPHVTPHRSSPHPHQTAPHQTVPHPHQRPHQMPPLQYAARAMATQPPRPTVSVTSLVHEMHRRQRRDSPLDLSVKTVKHSADSTADAPPRPVNNPIQHHNVQQQHKVDYSPDFGAASPAPAHAVSAPRRAPQPYLVDNRYQPPAKRAVPRPHPHLPSKLMRYETWADDSRIAEQRALTARPVLSYRQSVQRHPAADQRVLSILRSSLESRQPAATIVIDDDSPPPPPPHPSPDSVRTIRTKAELKGYCPPASPAPPPPELLKTEPINIEAIERDAIIALPPPPPLVPLAPTVESSSTALETSTATPPRAPSADAAWDFACDSFVQQLQTGCDKKNRRRRDHETPDDVKVKPELEIKQEPLPTSIENIAQEKEEETIKQNLENIRDNLEETQVKLKGTQHKFEDIKDKCEDNNHKLEDKQDIVDVNNSKEIELKSDEQSAMQKKGVKKKSPIKQEKSPERKKSVKVEKSLKQESAHDKGERRSLQLERRCIKGERREDKVRRSGRARNADGPEATPTRDQLRQIEQNMRVQMVDIMRVKREPESSDDDEPLIRSKLQKERGQTPGAPHVAPHSTRPGFGDGSAFRPGWEDEVYRYKRSLRMPPRLLSPWRPSGAASLPDLAPASVSPAPSGRAHTAPLDRDSDPESTRLGYDSEASGSTEYKPRSILDLLISKCGRQPPARARRPEAPSPAPPPTAPPSPRAPSLRAVFGGARAKPRVKRVRPVVRDGLRSTSLLKSDARGRLLRLRKRNSVNKLRELVRARPRVKRAGTEPLPSASQSVNQSSQSVNQSSQPTHKRVRRLFARRKLSSGFDYIRKKKKAGAGGAARRRDAERPSAESEHDLRREIKSWFVNKGVGETPLHRAARLGYADCAAYCLESLGAAPSACDNAGYTPLHTACAHGRTHIARLLLQYGADVSAAAHGGVRPLHEACSSGCEQSSEIARLLLSYGADPTLATYAGHTPQHLAREADDPALADLLRLHVADVQGTPAPAWRFPPPYAGDCDALRSPPPPPPPSPPAPLEVLSSELPLPPLYALRDAPQDTKDALWCLLHDVTALLRIKSREALLRAVGAEERGLVLVELRTHEFLERAVCLQLLGSGEKVNVRASRVALVRLTPRLRRLLRMRTTTIH